MIKPLNNKNLDKNDSLNKLQDINNTTIPKNPSVKTTDDENDKVVNDDKVENDKVKNDKVRNDKMNNENNETENDNINNEYNDDKLKINEPALDKNLPKTNLDILPPRDNTNPINGEVVQDLGY